MLFKTDNENYEIIIIKKNNKNTYIRVKEDLKIYITTNQFARDKDIEKLIIANYDSIKDCLEKMKRKKQKNDKNFILGKEVDIIKLSNQTHPELYGNKFYIKDNNIDKYLKEFAVDIYEKRVKEIYNMFSESIPYPNIKIRKMSTRWGVCNKKNKTITLNLELIKKDIKYLDYVIVHELCHFIHFDHSKEFWNLVSKYCPNYKQLRKEMRDDN